MHNNAQQRTTTKIKQDFFQFFQLSPRHFLPRNTAFFLGVFLRVDLGSGRSKFEIIASALRHPAGLLPPFSCCYCCANTYVTSSLPPSCLFLFFLPSSLSSFVICLLIPWFVFLSFLSSILYLNFYDGLIFFTFFFSSYHVEG